MQIFLQFVPDGSIDSEVALVQVKVWQLIGDKPLPDPMLTQICNATWHH